MFLRKYIKVKIWNTAFLKRHDMSGFLDNSFLFYDGMSGFCNIVFQKWIHQSGKSQLSLPFWKSQPRIWEITLPGVQNPIRNLGHDIAQGGMTMQNPDAILPSVHYECLKSETRKCTVCKTLSEIRGTTLHGVQ